MNQIKLINYMKDQMFVLSITQSEYAARLGISTTYLNDVIHGRKAPGKLLLDGLGIVKITHYEFMEDIENE